MFLGGSGTKPQSIGEHDHDTWAEWIDHWFRELADGTWQEWAAFAAMVVAIGYLGHIALRVFFNRGAFMGKRK